jgi:hypothetical protein
MSTEDTPLTRYQNLKILGYHESEISMNELYSTGKVLLEDNVRFSLHDKGQDFEGCLIVKRGNILLSDNRFQVSSKNPEIFLKKFSKLNGTETDVSCAWDLVFVGGKPLRQLKEELVAELRLEMNFVSEIKQIAGVHRVLTGYKDKNLCFFVEMHSQSSLETLLAQHPLLGHPLVVVESSLTSN